MGKERKGGEEGVSECVWDKVWRYRTVKGYDTIP